MRLSRCKRLVRSEKEAIFENEAYRWMRKDEPLGVRNAVTTIEKEAVMIVELRQPSLTTVSAKSIYQVQLHYKQS